MREGKMTIANRYRLSFIINTTLGGLMFVLGLICVPIEIRFPAVRGTLAVGIFPGAIVCLVVGFVHRRKYLSLRG